MSGLSVEELNKVSEVGAIAERRAPYGTQPSRGFRDLSVWKAGMDLVELCYRTSQSFPTSEQFGLTDQLRRAAVSVTSNIAEGWGRNTQAEFARFVAISQGSLCEVESLIEVSMRMGYLNESTYSELLERANKVGAMTYRLRSSLRR